MTLRSYYGTFARTIYAFTEVLYRTGGCAELNVALVVGSAFEQAENMHAVLREIDQMSVLCLIL